MNIKFILVSILLLIFLTSVPTNVAFALTAKEKQKAALEQQQAAAAAAAAAKAAEAAKMKSQIAVVENQIDETQNALNTTNSSISETNNKINELSEQIKTQEENLAKQKEKLDKLISSWYMEGEVGFFETIFSARSLSDLISSQQYYNSIKQQVNNAVDQINATKLSLNTQKNEQQAKMAELQTLQQQQISYKKTVESQKSLKTQLLTMTESQQKQYLATVEKLKGEIATVSAEIYAERQRNRYNESIIYGSSTYPYTSIDVPDPWGFLTRECTSYAAWYWNSRLGRNWYRGEGPTGTGDAANWPNLASRNGVSVHSSARVGAIISWQRSGMMPYGHVAIVEAVNGDGTVDISEYNWSRYAYTYRKNVNPGNYGGYSYIY